MTIQVEPQIAVKMMNGMATERAPGSACNSPTAVACAFTVGLADDARAPINARRGDKRAYAELTAPRSLRRGDRASPCDPSW